MFTPLENMLRKQKNRNTKILIEGETVTAFYDAKNSLGDFTKLFYISDDANSTLTLTTDASGDSIGTVLHQKQDGLEKPISFFAIKLSNAQQKYGTSRE